MNSLSVADVQGQSLKPSRGFTFINPKTELEDSRTSTNLQD